VYNHGPGIQAARKRWFLKVAGSRIGHHLQGEVPGGMTLVVFAARGPAGSSDRGYPTAVRLLWGRPSPGGFLRLGVLRRPKPALLCGRQLLITQQGRRVSSPFSAVHCSAPQVRPNCARFGHWACMCDPAVNLLDAGLCRRPFFLSLWPGAPSGIPGPVRWSFSSGDGSASIPVVGFARMRLLQDVLTGLTPPRYRQPRRLPSRATRRNPAIGTGSNARCLACLALRLGAFSVHLRAEGNNPVSILKDLNSFCTS
jgi:hypothetical protein